MKVLHQIFTNSRSHSKSRTKVIDSMLSGVGLPQNGDALEIGCGAGFASAHLANRYGMKVTGTDADAERIKVAKKKNGENDRLIFIQADATRLPFEDSSFDMVLAQNAFHHIEEWKTAAMEVARVLLPGGRFLLSEIKRAGAGMRIFAGLEREHGFHHAEDLISIMNDLGVKVIKRMEPEELGGNQFAILYEKA